MVKTEEVVCANPDCRKKFKRYIKKRKYRRKAGIRGFKYINCSKLCSAKYASLPRRIKQNQP